MKVRSESAAGTVVESAVPAETSVKTYTAVSGGIRGKAQDAIRLYQVRTTNLQAYIDITVQQVTKCGATFLRLTNKSLENKDVLIVGAGQTLREAVAFGATNRVIGIDLDVMPQGWRPGQYYRLLRTNGAMRAAKTIGRKLLGIDRTFHRELRKKMALTGKPDLVLRQMDATSMTFPSDNFDFVYSFSVFEHLDNPRAALSEAIRVLRPGGVLIISTHMYASEGGCHDLRIFAGRRDEIPLWAQLRPEHKHTVVESCYMNKWRLSQWQELFDELCPGGQTYLDNHHEPLGSRYAAELATIRGGGELADYTDEELLSVNVVITHQKPLASTEVVS